MIKNSQKQNGSAHIVIIVVIIVGLLGVLGYVFWQNFITKDTSETAGGNKQTTTQSNETPDNQVEEVQDSNDGYLVLEDWEIKFKLPENLGEIHYYKEKVTNDNGSFDYYSFSTKRVEELGDRCSPDNGDGTIHLASISRSNTRLDQVANAVPVNNNEPIDGFYYYVSGGQSYCANENEELQQTDKSLIETLLLNPIAIE